MSKASTLLASQETEMVSLPTPPAPALALNKDDIITTYWIEPLKNGIQIMIRPLESKDREREFAFIKALSPESRHFRFLCTMNEPSEGLLDQLMGLDYARRMAYVALTVEEGQLCEIGVARYAASGLKTVCESAVVVADKWQRQDLAKKLMKHLIDAAKVNGFDLMFSIDSATNSHMHRLAEALGFECGADPLDATQVVYRLNLSEGASNNQC
jgi:GNAT superfamily N-acetyltransferase